MTTKQQSHIHDYKKLGWLRDFQTAICRGNKLVPHPEPKDVHRIILIRSCECGKSQAFECGDKEKMRVLLASLTKGNS